MHCRPKNAVQITMEEVSADMDRDSAGCEFVGQGRVSYPVSLGIRSHDDLHLISEGMCLEGGRLHDVSSRAQPKLGDEVNHSHRV
jgi:hypothetical protein